MLLYTTRDVARCARRLKISDEELRDAVVRAEAGSIDASLGSQLIKQRIAKPGAGRSGGSRSIIFYKAGDLGIFLHLFEKNRQANVNEVELQALRDLAKALAALSRKELRELASRRRWKEIGDGREEEDVSK